MNVHACAAAENLPLSVHRGLLFVSPGQLAQPCWQLNPDNLREHF